LWKVNTFGERPGVTCELPDRAALRSEQERVARQGEAFIPKTTSPMLVMPGGMHDCQHRHNLPADAIDDSIREMLRIAPAS
jgi:hypothetical protein